MLRAPLLAVLLALAVVPAAEAPHPGLVGGVYQGWVLTLEGPVPARMSVPWCEGPRLVYLELATSQGAVREVFEAEMDFLPPWQRCLDDRVPAAMPSPLGTLSLPTLATGFRLTNESLGVAVAGTIETDGHVFGAAQYGGLVHWLPAAFAVAAA